MARATAAALAEEAGADLVTVVGRDLDAAANVAAIGSFIATAVGSRRHFASSASDDVAMNVRALGADLVVLLASHQSPWEGLVRPSAWTTAMAECGVALTLPLQASLAVNVGAAAAGSGAAFINGCLPDVVNPLLAAAGVPVLTGVGNAGVLALAAATSIGVPQASVRVLAHHIHLRSKMPPCCEALIWTSDGVQVDTTTALRSLRSIPRRLRNTITGRVCAQVVNALAVGKVLDTAAPGPLGLPGGYSIRIQGGAVRPTPPPGWALDDCIDMNQQWSRADGVSVENRFVTVSAHIRPVIASIAPHLADGFNVKDLDRIVTDLIHIRTELRQRTEDACHA